MEMPVPCNKCGEWVELNDTRQSPYSEELICPECYNAEEARKEIENEIRDLEEDLENEAEYTVGHRREHKKQLKELRERLVKCD